jgi:predicted amidohydrolase
VRDSCLGNELVLNHPFTGRLMGKYRKIHLYDVDIPGGISMRESDVISPGSQPFVIKFRMWTAAPGSLTVI